MSEKDKRMEVSDALCIFPTCVWKIQLTSGFRQKINSKILQVINQINPVLASSINAITLLIEGGTAELSSVTCLS